MKGWLARTFAVLFLAIIAVGAVRSMDAIAIGTRVETTSVATRTPQEPTPATHDRLFVLMVDSLRYATATDPEKMPHLVSMQARSTHAKTISSRDAVTVSALRAAFTGRDGFSVLGFVRNFWRGDANIDSLFRQAQASGVAAAIYSDGSFDQFGSAVADFRDNEPGDDDEASSQDGAAASAVGDFVEKGHDLVVFHLTYSDHAAHKYGVFDPAYDRAFRRVDDLIARIDRAIPESDTFLVMGDHGHDVDGRHALGLDIPTYSAYRGARFRRGFDIGTISITEHRFLASSALGLPVDPAYAGARHFAALVGTIDAPADHVAADAPVADDSAPRASRRSIVALAAYLGLLAAVWLFLARSTLSPTQRLERARGPLSLATSVPWACAAAAPLFVADAHLAATGVGCSVAAAWLIAATRRSGLVGRALSVIAPAALGVGLAGWGYELAVHRVDIHEPLLATLETLWEIAAITGAILACLFGAMRVAWGLFGVTAVLFYPTVYRYGSTGTMAIVWCCWLLFLGLEHAIEQGRLHARGPALRRWIDALANLVPGGIAAVLLLPFFFPSSDNFRFKGWAGEFALDDAPIWFTYALVAKVIVFAIPARLPRARTWPSLLLGAIGAIAVAGVESAPGLMTGRWAGVGVLVAGAMAMGVTRGARATARPFALALSRVALLVVLFLAYAYFIRVPLHTRQTADGLFAALALSSIFLARLPRHASAVSQQAFVLALAVLAAGWATLAWTAHRLEWGFLYDWLPPELVERHVGWLSPLLLGRYAIPLLIARALVGERLGNLGRATRVAFIVTALKVLCLTAVLLGIGYVSAISNVYLEAVQEAGIFLLLLAGFVPATPMLTALSEARNVVRRDWVPQRPVPVQTPMGGVLVGVGPPGASDENEGDIT